MICVVRFHRTNDAQIIDAFSHVRKQRTNLGPAFSIWFEVPLRPLEIHVEVPLSALKFIDRDRLSGIRNQLRLGVP